MNKKVLLLTASLLALAMLVTPVMAVSPKKIPVTITRGGPSYTPAPDVWISGNVRHSRGDARGWSIFEIEGVGMDPLIGSVSSVGDYDVNIETGRGAHRRKVTLTFPGGTFEGHNNMRGIFEIQPSGFAAPIDGTMHAVFHGTDAYQGWTFVWTREAGQPFEAYMLIP